MSTRTSSLNAGQKQVYVGKKDEQVHKLMNDYSKFVTVFCYLILALVYLATLALTMQNSNVPLARPALIDGAPGLELDVPANFSITFICILAFTFFLLITTISIVVIYRHTFVVRNRSRQFNATLLFNASMAYVFILLTVLDNTYTVFFSFNEQVVLQSSRSKWTFQTFPLAAQFFIFFIGVSYLCRFKLFYDVFVTPEQFSEQPPMYGVPLYFIMLLLWIVSVFPSEIGTNLTEGSQAWNITNQLMANLFPTVVATCLSLFYAFKTRSVSSRFLNFNASIRIVSINFIFFFIISIWGIFSFQDPQQELLRFVFTTHVSLLAIGIVCIDSYIDPLIRFFLVTRNFKPPQRILTRRSSRKSSGNTALDHAANLSTTNLVNTDT
eukprot:Awhi_evm1s4322